MAKVEMYTTKICPFCVKAKNLLNKKKISFTEIDVTNNDDLRVSMMQKAEGRRSVPQIFINDTPIGGCDELYALDAAGELDRMLS